MVHCRNVQVQLTEAVAKTADTLSTGDIVIATNGSSFFFDGTKWTGIGTEVFVANHRVKANCGGAGEFVFDPTSTLVGSLQECTAANTATPKTADTLSTGDIVIATNGSSFFFDGTKWTGIGTEVFVANHRVKANCGGAGEFVFDPTSTLVGSLQECTAANTATPKTADTLSTGDIVIATNGSSFFFDGTKWTGIGTEVFVANHRVKANCGTAGEFVFDPTSTLVGSLQECTGANTATPKEADTLSTGDIVIATNGSSFFFDGTKWTGIGTEVFVANHRVKANCTTAGEFVFDPTNTEAGSLQECTGTADAATPKDS